MAEKNFRVGVLQFAVSPQPAENEKKALHWVEKAAQAGAQVVCLPELYRAQYFCQKEDAALFDLAETIPNDSTRAFQAAAAKHGVALVLPIFERRAPGVYHNSAIIIDADGADLGLYRKMHIPDDPAYYEKFYFAPGDLGFKAFTTKHGRIGTLICWDQWYPEGARLTALRGASCSFLSHGHRLASHSRKTSTAQRTAGLVDHHPALARDRQRRLCRLGKSLRLRAPCGDPGRHRVLGLLLHLRSPGPDHRPGQHGPGGSTGGWRLI
jgi:predicted amidohydrolase